MAFIKQPAKIVVLADELRVHQLEQELRFFIDIANPLPILVFPDRETLPYDEFSPHQAIISERLLCLSQIPQMQQGLVLTSLATMMHRLPPLQYIDGSCFSLSCGEELDLNTFRAQLIHRGYHHVQTVMAHGEFSIRGSLIDIFPMGASTPYRINLFDTEVELIKTFDVDSQLSVDEIKEIRIFPAKEYPLTKEALDLFNLQWDTKFGHGPNNCPLYKNLQSGVPSAGIEYYLPLFFEHTHSLFDYLPSSCVIALSDGLHETANHYWEEVKNRYEQRAYDVTRPVLAPKDLFVVPTDFFQALKRNTIPNRVKYYGEKKGGLPKHRTDDVKQPFR